MLLVSAITPSYHSIDSNMSGFLATLVAQNLMPVLKLNAHVTYRPLEVMPVAVETIATPVVAPITAKVSQPIVLSEKVYQSVSRIARHLYFNNQDLPITLEDLEQEGFAAALKGAKQYAGTGVASLEQFAILVGKRAMRDCLIRLIRNKAISKATSLEAYLVTETDKGTHERELADTPAQNHHASDEERRPILAALRQLTEWQRFCIMARFAIEDEEGYVVSPDEVQKRLRITPTQYDSACTSAKRRLAQLLTVD